MIHQKRRVVLGCTSLSLSIKQANEAENQYPNAGGHGVVLCLQIHYVGRRCESCQKRVAAVPSFSLMDTQAHLHH